MLLVTPFRKFSAVSETNTKSPVVTQSNKLTEARYTLTVAEQRLVLTLISLLSPDDDDFKDYEMKVSDFKQMLGINTNAIYEQIKDVLKRLASRVIYIPDGDDYLITNWFSSAKYIASSGSVRITFDRNLKPYLLELKKEFTKYKLFIVGQFKSGYTIRIYMLLKQYESIGYREFDIDEFREILDIESKKYPQFKALRQWVINQAKKEFETKNPETGLYQSDITFELDTIRTGRKITRIRFNIKQQAYQESLPLDMPLDIPKADIKELSAAAIALKRYGIKGELAESYLEQQTEAEILRCIELLELAKKQRTVKSDGAYLRKLLEERAGDITEVEQVELETIKQQQAEQQKQQQDKQRDQLEKAFFKAARDEFIRSLSEQEQQQLLLMIKTEDKAQGDLIKSLDSPFANLAIKAHIPCYEEKKEAYIKQKLNYLFAP